MLSNFKKKSQNDMSNNPMGDVSQYGHTQGRHLKFANLFAKTKILWLVACFFYSFQLVLRVFPNILIDQLSQDFGLNSYQMGMLSSAYYNAYAFVQLPAGILLDKFNVRTILITSLLCCLIGSAIFISSTNIYIAYAARFLTGFGAGFALLSSIKAANLATQAPKRLSFMIGLNFSMAMAFVGISASFINAVVNFCGWRQGILVFLSVLIVLLFMAFYAKQPKTQEKSTLKEVLSIVKSNCAKVLKNKQLYILSFYGFCTYIPISCFCDLWGSKFLNIVYGVDYAQSVSLCMTIYIGLAVGSVFWPYFASIIKSYKFILIFAEIGVVTCFSLLVLFREYFTTVNELYLLLFLLGLSSSSTLLAYGILSNIYGKELAATANGVYNLSAMMSGVVFQPVIGKIIDYLSAGRQVQASDFITTFTIFCILPTIAILSTVFVKVSYKSVQKTA